MRSIILIATAALVVCFQLVALNTLSAKLLPLSIVGYFFLAFLAQSQAGVRRHSLLTNNNNAAGLLIAFLILMVVWQLYQHLTTGAYGYLVDAVLEQSFDAVALLAVLLLVGLRFSSLTGGERIGAIAVGVALFGLANLIASYLGYIDLTEFGGSRLDPSKMRWRAPLAMSTGTLGTLQTVAACYLLFFTFADQHRGRISGSSLQRLLFAAAFISAAFTVYLCEFRYSLIVVAVTVLAIASNWVRQWWWCAGIAAMLVFPVTEWCAEGWVEDTAGVFLSNIVASTGTVAETFSETNSYASRAHAWLYALDALRDPLIFLFGEGPVLRDANPGLPEAGWSESAATTTNYHSAFVNLVMTAGAPMAFTVMFSLLAIAMRQAKAGSYSSPLAITAYGAAWAWVGIIDGGMFGHVEVMILSIAPIVAVNASVDSNADPHAEAVTSHT